MHNDCETVFFSSDLIVAAMQCCCPGWHKGDNTHWWKGKLSESQYLKKLKWWPDSCKLTCYFFFLYIFFFVPYLIPSLFNHTSHLMHFALFVLHLYSASSQVPCCTMAKGHSVYTLIHTHKMLDCFTLLLARHLADVSCFIGPSMPSGICMEIHTEIV